MTNEKSNGNLRRWLRDVWMRLWPSSYHAYSERVRNRLPDHPMEVACCGFKMTIRSPRTSVIGRAILREGMWEPEVTRFAESVIKPGWVVLDVGADIGYYTLLFARLAGDTGRVVAFEPIQDSRHLLEQNIATNRWKHIQVHACALAASRGKARISCETRGRLSEQGSGDEVDLVPLDDLWASLGLTRLDMVKIDVEGAELGVLHGMEKVLRKFKPSLLLELHPDYLPKFDASVDAVTTFLRQQGYTFSAVDAPTIDGRMENTTIWCVASNNVTTPASS